MDKKQLVKKYIAKGLSYSIVLTIIIFVAERMNDKLCLALVVASFLGGILSSLVDRLSIIEKSLKYIENSKTQEDIKIEIPERRKTTFDNNTEQYEFNDTPNNTPLDNAIEFNEVEQEPQREPY
jgi:hypothetical protein